MCDRYRSEDVNTSRVWRCSRRCTLGSDLRLSCVFLLFTLIINCNVTFSVLPAQIHYLQVSEWISNTGANCRGGLCTKLSLDTSLRANSRQAKAFFDVCRFFSDLFSLFFDFFALTLAFAWCEWALRVEIECRYSDTEFNHLRLVLSYITFRVQIKYRIWNQIFEVIVVSPQIRCQTVFL